MLANFQSSGITAVLNDFLKIIANGIHVIHAVSLRILRCKPSGPGDLLTFKPLSFDKLCYDLCQYYLRSSP